ncbi:MAG TPA: DUF6089 family protein [Bacteroidales bacterium]|nr:DUF6089 family protein [Bacteroidales bacterium]
MKKIFFLLIFSVFCSAVVNAQLGTSWKKIRHEIYFGAGPTNFLGELGGANQIGTHFLRDFEIKATRAVFGVGYRYKLAPDWAVKTGLWYGWLSGADSLTLQPDRHDRDLSFRSPVLEWTANIEYSIIKERYGHRYDLRRVKGKKNLPNLYGFTGISAFYFNPKAKYTDGEWYALRPLGTEGQGLVPTREKYGYVAIAIPMGFGMNYMLDRNWGIGFEYGFRYTFSDYVDDVSTTYVDPNLFEDPIARYFSDPTLGTWIGTGPLQQRGDDHYTDCYMFLTINASYKLRPRQPGMPKF